MLGIGFESSPMIIMGLGQGTNSQMQQQSVNPTIPKPRGVFQFNF